MMMVKRKPPEGLSGRMWEMCYILDADHKPVHAETVEEWAEFYENFDKRRVAENYFGHEAIGEVRVSTVFLGLDTRFSSDGPPLVFETMIFGGGDGLDGYRTRTSTWDEALQTHADAIAEVKNAFSELAKASGA